MSGDQLDLDAVEAHLARGGRLHDALAPALVAEVRRLRAEVSALADTKPGATGRALRAILAP